MLKQFLFQTDWSPVHLAVHSDWPDCVDLLLTFDGCQSESLLQVRSAISQMVDKDEMTLTHLAAMKESPVSVINVFCSRFVVYCTICNHKLK
mgnify:CR=1 FL=1